MNNWIDEDITTQINNRQRVAHNRLYSRYTRRINTFCSHADNYPLAPDVKDLAQDIFLRVIMGTYRFDPGKASFRTWFFRITRHRSLDFERRNAREAIISRIKNRGSFLSQENTAFTPNHHQPKHKPERSLLGNEIYNTITNRISHLENEKGQITLLLLFFSAKLIEKLLIFWERCLVGKEALVSGFRRN